MSSPLTSMQMDNAVECLAGTAAKDRSRKVRGAAVEALFAIAKKHSIPTLADLLLRQGEGSE